MSYQVLARKWRPKSFEDLVGQTHVVRALTNALARGQLHHAYLFTGTRGVGKTTLARILAKALNCEQGVGPVPCGRCSACQELDEGRFLDLLEVDAASRTKVEQTRELLDNVPFAPVKGRFKVYLIDEVHMFSEKSFNALLKTLEEPPPHVKFLLATTDPQKLPVTVLSRCLQFNLKRLLPGEIQGQLGRVLEAEGIGYEPAALALLARGADGSMRDGLSLLDQAIAYGGGQVGEAETRAMLGVAGRDLSLGLVEALAAGDGARLLAEVARIAELAPDFEDVLRDLLLVLHRIALFQQVPQALADDDPDREAIVARAGTMAPEDVQLFYQILATGQADLALAPDPRTGMEMVLLRALAFRPVEEGTIAAPAANSPVSRSEAGSGPAPSRHPGPGASPSPVAEETGRVAEPAPPPPRPASRPGASTDAPPPAASQAFSLAGAEDWHRLIDAVKVGGMANELAHHCELIDWDGRCLRLNLDVASQHVRVASAETRLREALGRALGVDLRLEICLSRPEGETPAQRRRRQATERQAEAQQTMEQDPVARSIREQFNAEWVPGSIKPSH
ncbi:DNA polymerase III subunit gamma/tau [Thioflavicoccus mobilis]|uniref:DNA polymerase III subunit gamma/tau n=1 Tax=Thioflavicoccus mobilis TaxID=80679 RepID=UPI0002D320DB|nr:DNA polymerase III subunit gamma/tau [Thioflavicoccus mobilis]